VLPYAILAFHAEMRINRHSPPLKQPFRDVAVVTLSNTGETRIQGNLVSGLPERQGIVDEYRDSSLTANTRTAIPCCLIEPARIDFAEHSLINIALIGKSELAVCSRCLDQSLTEALPPPT
jgi:hypothetical protein